MLKKTISMAAVSALYVFATPAFAVDINPGNWEHKAVMEVTGMPFAVPPVTTTQCLSEEDTIPKAVGGEGQECKILDSKEDGNTVSWTIECEGEGGKSTGKGSITYSGDTYKGKTEATVGGMKMTSAISGKRLGPCK